MSQRLISRSPDLRRLRDEGYDVAHVAGYVVLRDVPYVDSERRVCRGTLVSTLHQQGEAVGAPDTHVMLFAGRYPCRADGSAIEQIRHSTADQVISPDLVVNHSFSARHATGYPDYYAKFTTYVQILSSEAQRIEPTASACTFPPVPDDDADSPFQYLDTASSRAGLSALSAKVAGQRLAIVGLGGTGSYVLDLVSKTPVREIHLIDADTFCNHNAFRSPGAATLPELEAKQAKVHYLAARYGHMHRGLHAHQVALTGDNMGLLSGLSFAFLCLDDGVAKGPILGVLERDGIPYIDVGMGVYEQAGGLAGQVRVTSHSAAHRRAASDRQRIPISAAVPTGEYATNIQIAELNALNAALAVIRWKKMFGFYADTELEHNSVYVIDGNSLVNGDLP